jgi:two-component system OmpR family response regulator
VQAGLGRAIRVLAAGDLTLDPSQHLVARGGTRIELTPREYGVLEFQMRRKGTVLAKTDILAGVWDAHYDGGENVVEVYIRYLRKKIDEPFGRQRQAIRTVRGAGYLLDPDGG